MYLYIPSQVYYYNTFMRERGMYDEKESETTYVKYNEYESLQKILDTDSIYDKIYAGTNSTDGSLSVKIRRVKIGALHITQQHKFLLPPGQTQSNSYASSEQQAQKQHDFCIRHKENGKLSIFRTRTRESTLSILVIYLFVYSLFCSFFFEEKAICGAHTFFLSVFYSLGRSCAAVLAHHTLTQPITIYQ